MSPNYQRLRSRQLITVALLLACLAALVFVAARRPPGDATQLPQAQLLDSSYKIPRQSVPLFYRWVPTTPGWGWFWRLKEFVTGRVKPVSLKLAVVTLTSAPDKLGADVLLPKPELTGTNSVEIWLLDGTSLNVFQSRLLARNVQASQMAVTTGDGIQAMVQCGTTLSLPSGQMFAGVRLDVLPRIHGNRVDLIALGAQTEVVITNLPEVSGLLFQTNFSVAARMQITNGGAAFILDQPHRDGRRMAMLISATLPAVRK